MAIKRTFDTILLYKKRMEKLAKKGNEGMKSVDVLS